jgi:glycosyltransferase involved in cell wall biosynthesis
MPKTPKVLLLTNYRKDEQRSMLRFGELLSSGLSSDSIECSEIFPEPRLLPLTPTSSLKKWSGYVDKYMIFPRRLTKFLNNPKTKPDLLHVIDHSNAVYMNRIPSKSKTKRVLTCHDLIALRMSKNEFPDAPRISKTGKQLQNWVCKSLGKADAYACDSSFTEKDLNRIIPHSKGRSEVIHLGVPPKAKVQSRASELPFDPSNTKYLLHVGSSAWYKNRKAILTAFSHLLQNSAQPTVNLVFVGPRLQKEELTDETKTWMENNKSRVVALDQVEEQDLRKLYQYARAFVFPSFVEGFGWPPLEANAMGCPVITTRTGAIADILGNSATYVDPANQREINQALLNAMNKEPLAQSSSAAIPTIEDCVGNYASLYVRTIKNSHA